MAGARFIFPPRRRLFAVFDEAGQAAAAEAAVTGSGLAGNGLIWSFEGAEGVRALDPGPGHRGVLGGFVHGLQRMLTGDCEYRDGLVRAVSAGAVVLAVPVAPTVMQQAADELRRHGGHSLAYGAHWDFVPLPHATHTPGAMTDFVPGRR